MMLPNWPRRCAIALVLAPAVVIGQTAQDQPTFRSGIQSIEVDVLVTDKSGNAVRGLTRDDFTLVEDDTPQQITNFTFVELPVEPSTTRKAAVTAIPSDVTTNEDLGRTYVMVLNSGGPRLRLIARRFVEEAVGPHDQAAVVHLCGNMSAAQGFTTNRQLMLAAIDRYFLDVDGATDARSFSCDTVVKFNLIEEMAERLGLLTGRRKAVFWFDPPSVFHGGGPDPAGQRFAQRDAVRALTRNNVGLYVVDTQGLTTGLGNLEMKAGLRVLADDTGGDIIVDSNNFSSAFERFVRDNSIYYLLGYVPEVEHRDGKFHNLRVRVNRPGLTVRARRGYYAPEADPKVKPSPPVVDGLSKETAAALRMPSSLGELGIELSVAPFKGTSRNGSVLLDAQLRGTDLALGSREPIEIAFQAMTTEGKISPGGFKVFTLDFSPESHGVILRTGIRVIDRIELPRGRHQVRFAVHQPNGKTGTVVADVEIPDFSGPLVMSGVVLGSQETAAHRTLMSDVRLKSILGSDPTAVRRFDVRDVISAFAEVYTDLRQSQSVRVTARLTTASGKSVDTLESSVVQDDEPGRTGYVTRIRLADLKPGDYVLTFEARRERLSATRHVPFAVISD